MNEKEASVLVLFSGGMDSFLAACREVTKGKHVTLMSFDSGTIQSTECFQYGAERLIKKFGEDKVDFAGVYAMAGVIQSFTLAWLQTSYKDFAAEFPNVTPCQLNCLHCQSAMWTAAIAYAKAHDIHELSCGYKQTDQFCTGISDYIDLVGAIAQRQGVFIHLPMWQQTSDWRRSIEMEWYAFTPKVQEPRCVLGCASASELSDAEKADLMSYFRKAIYPDMNYLIEELTAIFSHIKIDTVISEKMPPVPFND